MTTTCGAKTRKGGQCGRPRGWATTHPGWGRCKLHGGASPSGEQAAQHEKALAEGKRYIGSVDVTPEAAILSCVSVSIGLRDSYLSELAAFDGEGGDRYEFLRLEARRATREAAMNAKAAIDAGVAQRLVALAERTGAAVSASIEDGLAALRRRLEARGFELTEQDRAVFIASALHRLESFEGQAEDITDRPALTTGAAA
jgi:hypothetical protein